MFANGIALEASEMLDRQIEQQAEAIPDAKLKANAYEILKALAYYMNRADGWKAKAMFEELMGYEEDGNG